VLPFYAERGIKVDAVLTDNGREFCGTDHHPFELYLALNDIEHRRTKVRRPQTNLPAAYARSAHGPHGSIERFNRTILDEFFRTSLRDAAFDRLDDLQARLDAWLVHYNHERPHRGYRNMGRRPIETINQASPSVGHEG
jgi:transposase InsO family protein